MGRSDLNDLRKITEKHKPFKGIDLILSIFSMIKALPIAALNDEH